MTLRNTVSDCGEFPLRKPFTSYDEKSTKERKFAQLCGKRQPAEVNTHDDYDYQSKLVVTIPDDLSLSEAEKSVLNKRLTSVPVKKSTDEYQVKADCKKYLLLPPFTCQFPQRRRE